MEMAPRASLLRSVRISFVGLLSHENEQGLLQCPNSPVSGYTVNWCIALVAKGKYLSAPEDSWKMENGCSSAMIVRGQSSSPTSSGARPQSPPLIPEVLSKHHRLPPGIRQAGAPSPDQTRIQYKTLVYSWLDEKSISIDIDQLTRGLTDYLRRNNCRATHPS